jgi:transglutaminase-like putative cysteine protease
MNRIIILVLFLVVLVVAIGAIIYDQYYGWDGTPSLPESNGITLELIKPIPGLSNNEFNGATELEAVQQAADWVAANMQYQPDNGETWTPSDEQYAENPRTGDSEDYAILLCALLRFHTYGGTISADRVWVSATFENKPGIGNVVTQAWVEYKLEGGGLAYIEPRSGLIHRGRPHGTPIE